MEPLLRYSKLRPRACSPKRATEHSIGYDIKSPIDITIQSGTTALIPLGLAVEIPIGNYGRIAAKSEHALKYSLLILGGPLIQTLEERFVQWSIFWGIKIGKYKLKKKWFSSYWRRGQHQKHKEYPTQL